MSVTIKSIGLITYQVPHLKTEQILIPLLHRGYDLSVYALPFKYRKQRYPIFNHRPDHQASINTRILAEKHGIRYINCESGNDIDNRCDIYLIMGAAILPKEIVSNRFILNSHPGIIPNSRGLDAFKWAILQKRRIGVTLHRIDETVDYGTIYSVQPTPVYKEDKIEYLARRHYENEINILLDFERYLNEPINDFKDIEVQEPTRRMKPEQEQQMLDTFHEYLKQYKSL